MEAHPQLARELAERGHALALHGHRHVEHDRLPDPAADLARCAELVEAATGVTPRLCRPPYGRFSAASYEACRAAGLAPILWSAWGSDWEPIPADRVADLVLRDLEPGAIVLLHDSARYAYRESALATAEALPRIIAAAREQGLESRGLRRRAPRAQRAKRRSGGAG